MDFALKVLRVSGDTLVKLQLWDVAGTYHDLILKRFGPLHHSDVTFIQYSDISNNRTGTAIYFQRKILPLRSY